MSYNDPSADAGKIIGQWIADFISEIFNGDGDGEFDWPSLTTGAVSQEMNTGELLSNVLNGASSFAGGISYDSAIGPSFGSTSSGNRLLDWFAGLFTNSGYQAQLNREFNSAEALKQREWQSAENQLAREFQLMMSNTAYQRGVQDLRAAGLNPILAYSQGGAASSAVSVGHGDAATSQGVAGSDLGAIANGMGSLAEGVGKILELLVKKKTGSIGFR